MEQNASQDQVLLDWLTNYTLFICDRFDLPHDQADELLRQYLENNARSFPQQPVTSLSEQPTRCPVFQRSYHEAYSREQAPISHLAMCSQDQPLSYSTLCSPHHEAQFEEEANQSSNSMGLLAHNATPQGELDTYDRQQDNMTTIDPDLLETSSSQQTQTLNQTSVGNITDYDPLWVQNNGVDPLRVAMFKSAMKFDALFRQGVITFGDVLTFQVSINANGQNERTEAHFKITGASRGQGGLYPHLSLSVLNAAGVEYPEVKACRGTNAMIEHLENCNISVLRSGWRDIQVSRGQQILGSLWWVKQAFHLWRDLKDQEAQEAGQTFRRRRARGKGKEGATQFNGAFGWWQNGVFQPDPDQGRYRPTG